MFVCILIIDCLPCGQDSLLCTAFYHRNTSMFSLSPEQKQKDGFLKRVFPSLFTVKCFSTRRDGRHTQSLGREAVESDRSVYVEETLSQFCQLLEIFKAYWKLGRHLTTIVLHPSFLFLMQHSVSYLLSQKTFLRCVCVFRELVRWTSKPTTGSVVMPFEFLNLQHILTSACKVTMSNLLKCTLCWDVT